MLRSRHQAYHYQHIAHVGPQHWSRQGSTSVPSCNPQHLRVFAGSVRAISTQIAKAVTTTMPETVTEQAPATTAGSTSIPTTPPPGTTWYFAYGSNMNPKTLTGRRKVEPQVSAACKVPGWALSFYHLGLPFAEPGFATVVPLGDPRAARVSGDDAPVVQGVVHLITDQEWLQIQRTEGVGSKRSGYQVIRVRCELYNGEEVEAHTLCTHNNSLGQVPRVVLPSVRYRTLLAEGAAHHNLDPTYCKYLAEVDAFEPSTTSKKVGRYLTLLTALFCVSPFLPILIPYRFLVWRARTENRAPGWWLQVYLIQGIFQMVWTMHDWVLSPLLGSGSSNKGKEIGAGVVMQALKKSE